MVALAYVPIHIVFQIIEVLICFGLFTFYAFQRYRGRCGWEVLYVSLVTPISYILTMALPSQYTALELTSGQTFFWFRYAGWFITCPIMLELLCRIVVPRKPSTDFLMKILVTDLLLTTCGVTGAIQKEPTIKWIFVGIAFFLLMFIYWTIYRVFQLSNDRRRGIDPKQASYRRNIMFLTFTTWLIFPCLFFLGPESFKVITVEYSIVGHCIGDILSKNLYTFLSWHFRNVYMKRDWKTTGSRTGTSSYAGSDSTLASESTKDFDTFSMSQLSGFGRSKYAKKKHARQAKKEHRRNNSNESAKRLQPEMDVEQQRNSYSNRTNGHGHGQGHAHHHHHHSQRSGQRPQQKYMPEESDTDVSEWNPAAQDANPLAEKPGMRSEWESNMSLAQEVQPVRGMKKQTSRHGEGFLDKL